MYVIDRFEGSYAVCENQDSGDMVNILRDSLPKDAKEGHCIEVVNGRYVINYEMTAKLKKEAEELARDMWK